MSLPEEPVGKGLTNGELSRDKHYLIANITGYDSGSEALSLTSSSMSIVLALSQMEDRLLKKIYVSTNQVKELLRRAASLLCRTDGDPSSVAAHFVRIPFLLFSKQIMKFSLTLWMGVIKENPQMEPRILVEIIEGWIITVRGRLGIFNKNMTYVQWIFLQGDADNSSGT